MAKVIFSPVGRWPGSVTLSDPLTFPQKIAFQEAIDVIWAMQEDKAKHSYVHYEALKGICVCVEKWEIEGFPENITPDTFPATPEISCYKLIAWLVEELTGLLSEAEEVPEE